MEKTSEDRGRDTIKNAPHEDLFPDSFVSQWTDFHSFAEMVQASGFKQVEDLFTEQGRHFITARTTFRDFTHMVSMARPQWLSGNYI